MEEPHPELIYLRVRSEDIVELDSEFNPAM